MTKKGEATLFLVVPVPVRRIDGEIYLESQALHGLDMYAENFDHVTVAYPTLPERFAAHYHWDWSPVSALKNADRIRVLPLPWGYEVLAHLKAYADVVRLLDENIRHHKHLQFAIGGLFGDWGSLAGVRASKQKRHFAVWADRVEHRVIGETQNDTTKQKLKNALTLGPMAFYEKHVVRKAAVGLFNGNETWAYYRQFNANSHQVHDIHTKASQYISDEDLATKQARIRSGAPLKICYMGRVSGMKAPLEWLEAIHRASQQGVEFEAVWMGGGDLMEAMQAKVKEWGLQDRVQLPGFVSDHEYVLKTMQQADVFLFTHVTPESPRCLIETLVSGTPMVGYRSDYSSNLVLEHGGGELVDMHDIKALADAIVRLHGDRERLAWLTEKAAQNGHRFSDVEAFRERAKLIKRYT